MHTGTASPVVVGVDESASARDAAEWAADLAAVWAVPLRLVHVVPGWPEEGSLPAIPSWLHEMADATERSGVRDVTADVVPGGVVQTLADRAAGARMLVVGSYGEGAWTGMLAGGAAVSLVDRTTCPVAVIRGSAPQIPPPRGGPVVVGSDGSPAANSAVDLAAELAASLGSRLVTVQAVSAVPVDLATTRIVAVRERYPRLPVQQQLVAGTALTGLAAYAREARMLVIGRHVAGEPGDPGVVLGVTGHGLVESAPCPVVIQGSRGPRRRRPARCRNPLPAERGARNVRRMRSLFDIPAEDWRWVMREERQRHSRRDRLPRRAADRLEDLVAWTLTTLALLTAVAAVTLAVRLYGAGMHRVDVETRERTEVQAVLLEQARYAIDVNEHGRAVRRLPVPVPAQYTVSDGTERRAEALVLGPLPAGTTVLIWVDRFGTVTSAPARSVDAVRGAAVGGAGVLAVGAVVLGGIWMGARAGILRLNAARWAREWEQVEPQWNGRTR